jgi:hypothetical protein
MSQARKRRITITEYLNVHGCYVGGMVGSEDGYKLAWSRHEKLNPLLEQTFSSRDDLLAAIDAL